MSERDSPGALLTCPDKEELLAEVGWYAEGVLMLQPDWRSVCKTAHELKLELTHTTARWK